MSILSEIYEGDDTKILRMATSTGRACSECGTETLIKMQAVARPGSGMPPATVRRETCNACGWIRASMLLAILLLCPVSVFACTATSVVEAAAASKGQAVDAAREAAIQFIHDEQHLEVDATIEAATGTLLMERDVYGIPVANGGWNASDWTAAMDLPVSRHGRTATGKLTSSGTVRDHVRLHVLHFTDALEGRNDYLLNWWESTFGPIAPTVPLQHWGG